MQKAIAKYGLAAHLAIVAVAPLFLFPYFSGSIVACVLICLSALSATWLFVEPSVRREEVLGEAQWRVRRAVVQDSLFIPLLVIAAFAGLRALNGGVRLSYDPVAGVWAVAKPSFAYFSGVVDGLGDLPFATVVAVLVVTEGCRHALGRSARMAFLLIASALSGLAALFAIKWAQHCPAEVVSSVGFSFSLFLLCGIVSVVAVFDRKWVFATPLLFFSVGGNLAGTIVFAPIFSVVVAVAIAVAIVAYSLFYAYRRLRSSDEYRILVVFGVTFVAGVLIAVFLSSDDVVGNRLSAAMGGAIFPKDFWKIRELLSGVAREAWTGSRWIGTGIGSIPLDIRFALSETDWTNVPRGVASVPNGWWQLLAERGIVGVVMCVLPVLLVLWGYGRGLIVALRASSVLHPASWLAMGVLLVVVACSFFDCSFLRPEAAVLLMATIALSESSFSRHVEVMADV